MKKSHKMADKPIVNCFDKALALGLQKGEVATQT